MNNSSYTYNIQLKNFVFCVLLFMTSLHYTKWTSAWMSQYTNFQLQNSVTYDKIWGKIGSYCNLPKHSPSKLILVEKLIFILPSFWEWVSHINLCLAFQYKAALGKLQITGIFQYSWQKQFWESRGDDRWNSSKVYVGNLLRRSLSIFKQL